MMMLITEINELSTGLLVCKSIVTYSEIKENFRVFRLKKIATLAYMFININWANHKNAEFNATF